jgi:hypothetical protein
MIASSEEERGKRLAAAEARIAELEGELEVVHQLLDLKRDADWARARRRRNDAMAKIRREYYYNEPHDSPPYAWRYVDGRLVHIKTGTPVGENEDIIDSLIEPAAARNDSRLECPTYTCAETFSFSDAAEFLDHVERCGTSGEDNVSHTE